MEAYLPVVVTYYDERFSNRTTKICSTLMRLNKCRVPCSYARTSEQYYLSQVMYLKDYLVLGKILDNTAHVGMTVHYKEIKRNTFLYPF